MYIESDQAEVSMAIFGSRHMLTILAEIARSSTGRFSLPALAASTGLPTSSIHVVLSRLKRVSLVRRTRDLGAERVAIYERRSHPTWAYALHLEAEVLAGDETVALWPSDQSGSSLPTTRP